MAPMNFPGLNLKASVVNESMAGYQSEIMSRRHKTLTTLQNPDRGLNFTQSENDLKSLSEKWSDEQTRARFPEEFDYSKDWSNTDNGPMDVHRQHYAAHSMRPAQRQKILMNTSFRSVGSMNTGGGTHPWRKVKWNPKQRWYRRLDPTKDKQPQWSFGKCTRMASYTVKEDIEMGAFWEKKPGPGAYFPSQSVQPFYFEAQHDKDQVCLGANHPIPWKDPLGNYINPVKCDVSSTKKASQKFSFSKTRRFANSPLDYVAVAAGVNAEKTDAGNLGPGFEYDYYHTMGMNDYNPKSFLRT